MRDKSLCQGAFIKSEATFKFRPPLPDCSAGDRLPSVPHGNTHTPKTHHNALSVPLWALRNTFSKEGFFLPRQGAAAVRQKPFYPDLLHFTEVSVPPREVPEVVSPL